MSAALLRQSLELVNSEVGGRKNKKKSCQVSTSGQGVPKPPYKKSKKIGAAKKVPPEDKLEQNLKRLQALSARTLDTTLTEKIVDRAVRGRAIADNIPVDKQEEDKPILFTEETFKQFERELFCS